MILYNDNGTIKKAGVRVNDGGVIKTPDQMDLFYNVDGNIVKFPKKSNVKANFNNFTFSTNEVTNLGFGATGDFGFVNIAGTGNTDATSLTNVDTAKKCLTLTTHSVGVKTSGNHLMRSGSATISMSFVVNSRTTWSSIWKFWAQDVDAFRLTYTENNKLTIGSGTTYNYPTTLTTDCPIGEKVTITVTIDNNTKTLVMYKNGVEVGNFTYTTNLKNCSTLELAAHNSYGTNNQNAGTEVIAVDYYNISIWDTALTAEEVKDHADIVSTFFK